MQQTPPNKETDGNLEFIQLDSLYITAVELLCKEPRAMTYLNARCSRTDLKATAIVSQLEQRGIISTSMKSRTKMVTLEEEGHRIARIVCPALAKPEKEHPYDRYITSWLTGVSEEILDALRAKLRAIADEADPHGSKRSEGEGAISKGYMKAKKACEGSAE